MRDAESTKRERGCFCLCFLQFPNHRIEGSDCFSCIFTLCGLANLGQLFYHFFHTFCSFSHHFL